MNNRELQQAETASINYSLEENSPAAGDNEHRPIPQDARPSLQQQHVSSYNTASAGTKIPFGENRPNVGRGNQPPDIESSSLESGRLNKPEEKDPYTGEHLIVDFDGPDDPQNPGNMPTWKKLRTTIILGTTTMVCTFASSVFSASFGDVARNFHVSEEVTVLGVSLFVLGFAFGPLVFGPASELFGRKLPLVVGYFLFAVFSFATAVAKDLQTIFITRFFGGFFASAPLAIVAGYLADFWDAKHRAGAIVTFSVSTFGGPALGPVVGGFIAESYLGWRWTEYITGIMASAVLVIDVLFLPETFRPVLLRRKASKLRIETKNWALHAKSEEEAFSVNTFVSVYLTRPVLMLLLEPMVLLLTIYISFVYGILYLILESVPIEFQETRGWSLGVGALPFLAFFLGAASGGLLIVAFQPRFNRIIDKVGKPVPEERILSMGVGAILFPIGLFWFGWSSARHVHWIMPMIGLFFTGAGVIMIFMSALIYLVDSYLWAANSAIAANTLMRSFTGAGFPLFAIPMMHNLGLDWGNSTLGFIAVAMIPIPPLFFFYGAKLRQLSRFAPKV